MKVRSLVLNLPSLLGRALAAVSLTVAILLGAMSAPAHAITRPAVVKRATDWIKKRIRYSQHSYYRGYRRDCSGFVSMAWRLKKSYTSSTIRGTARRISWRNLKPGDAVRRSGHVEIFARWKNKEKRLYVALEESGSGKPALRRVKAFRHGYSALRLRGIQEASTHLAAKPTPTPAPSVVPVTPPSIDASPSLAPSADASASVAAHTLDARFQRLVLA